MSWTSHIGAAFALGFALGAAPGPVQLLLLTETAKRGLSGGLRVMLGANGTLFLVMVALAFGFSSLAPSEGVLRALRVVGGAFLIYLAVDELRRVRREAEAMVAERHLLAEDTARVVERAALLWDFIHAPGASKA